MVLCHQIVSTLCVRAIRRAAAAPLDEKCDRLGRFDAAGQTFPANSTFFPDTLSLAREQTRDVGRNWRSLAFGQALTDYEVRSVPSIQYINHARPYLCRFTRNQLPSNIFKIGETSLPLRRREPAKCSHIFNRTWRTEVLFSDLDF